MKFAATFRAASLLCVFLATSTGTLAQTKILGLDDMSCAAWQAAKDDPEQRALYAAWLRGFLTGHNYAAPKQQVSTISNGTIELNIQRHCTANAQGNIADAVMRLSDQFSGRNQPIRK